MAVSHHDATPISAGRTPRPWTQLPNSDLLALHLAEGRTSPAATVHSLLTSGATWISNLGSQAYLTLGSYGEAHQVGTEAVDAYLRAAELDTDRTGFILALAAAAAGRTDQAKELFERARQCPDAPVLADIGLFMLDQRDDEVHPFVVPDRLLAALDDNPERPEVASFRAQIAMSRSDLDEAIRWWEHARTLNPDAEDIKLTLAEQLHHRARGHSSLPNDLTRAQQLADDAYRSIKRWAGPTGHALDMLTELLMSTNTWRRVLDLAAPPPIGSATDAEARHPGLRIRAVIAALAMDDSETARLLAHDLEDPADQAYAAAATATATTDDDAADLWVQALHAIGVQDRPALLTRIVSTLSPYGIDEGARLHPLIERGLLEPDSQRIVAAVALARTDPNAAVAPLRLLADTDPLPALTLIDTLFGLGHDGQAITAAQNAAEHLRAPELLLRAAQHLSDDQQRDRAEPLARAVLIDDAADPALRADAHAVIIAAAAHRLEWTAVAYHARMRVSLLEPHVPPKAIWQLVDGTYRSGSPDEAWRIIERYQLKPDRPDRMRFWADIALDQPVSAQLASELIRIATAERADPVFSSRLLGHVITAARGHTDETSPADIRPVIDDDLLRDAYSALKDLFDANPDTALPIRQLNVATPDDMFKQFSELARQNQENEARLRQTIDMVHEDDLPLGPVAVGARRPFGFILIQGGVGYYNAGSTDEAMNAAARAALRAALGQEVVIDETALIVASLLDAFDAVRSRYATLLAPDGCLRDVRAARSEALRSFASRASVIWDPDAGGTRIIEHDPVNQAVARARLDMLERAAAVTHSRPVDALDVRPNLDADIHMPWAGPLQLARNLGLALWADDVGLRRLAHAVDVPTFGTLDVLEYLRDTAIEGADPEALQVLLDAQAQFTRRCLRHRVVDVPTTIDELLDVAETDDFPADLAHVVVGRPAWWTWSPNPWAEMQQVLSAASRFPTASAWRIAAMNGAGRTSVGLERPDVTASRIAAALILPTARRERDDLHTLVEAARRISVRLNGSDPVAAVPLAAVELHRLGLVADPQEVASQFTS